MQTAIYAVEEQFKNHISLPVLTFKRLRCDPSIFQFDSCPLDNRQVIYNKDRHSSCMKMETVGSSRSDRCLLMACPSSTWDIKLLRACCIYEHEAHNEGHTRCKLQSCKLLKRHTYRGAHMVKWHNDLLLKMLQSKHYLTNKCHFIKALLLKWNFTCRCDKNPADNACEINGDCVFRYILF